MKKMTLKSYYESLGNPKTEIREKIVKECGVTPATVFRWLNGEVTPDKLKRAKVVEIIREYNKEATEESLFPNREEA